MLLSYKLFAYIKCIKYVYLRFQTPNKIQLIFSSRDKLFKCKEHKTTENTNVERLNE